MKSVVVAAAVGVLALPIAARPAHAADLTWTEATSPHFTVMSDDGARPARSILWQFEQVRAAVEIVWPWARVDLERPMLIIATKNVDGMKALAPQYWERSGSVHPSSVSSSGPDRLYVALRSDVLADNRIGLNPYVDAYWQYAQVVMSTSLRGNVPLWFSRGIARIMSNTLVTDSDIQIGRIIPGDLQRIRSEAHLTLPELVAVDRQSPWETDVLRRPTYDAECWVFVHFLLFGEDGIHQAALNNFVGELMKGKPAQAAFADTFGDVQALSGAFAAYLAKPLFPYSSQKVRATVSREAFPTRTLSLAEQSSARAALLASVGRPVEARSLLDAARKADANHADAFEVEGLLADRDRKPADAAAAYAKAIELNSSHYYPYYRWAVLSMSSANDASARGLVEQRLQRAIDLNDHCIPAMTMLVDLDQRTGKLPEAAAVAVRAVKAAPNDVAPRLALARVLWAAGQRDDAIKAANDALSIAQTPAETQAARNLLTTYQRGGSPAAGAPPPSPTAPNAPVRVGSQISTPTRIKGAEPIYPPEARTAGVQGMVIIEAIIGPDGTVTNTKVLRSIPLLDEAAEDAVRQWVYTPTLLNGRPVSVIMTVTVNFALK